MTTLRNISSTIRNEIIGGSGTQTQLDKANRKVYEIHYTYLEDILDKTKSPRLYVKNSRLDKKSQTWLDKKNQKISQNRKTKKKQQVVLFIL